MLAPRPPGGPATGMGTRRPGSPGVGPWSSGPVSHLNSRAPEFSFPPCPHTTWAHRDGSPGPLSSVVLPSDLPEVAQVGNLAQLALAWARSETRPASSHSPQEQPTYSLSTRNTNFIATLVLMATAPVPCQRSGFLPETLSFVRGWGHTAETCPQQEGQKTSLSQGVLPRGACPGAATGRRG